MTNLERIGRVARRLVAPLLLLGACSRPIPAEHTKPATVTHPVAESELSTITLTPQAAGRLGIALEPVEERLVGRRRTFGCEVTAPPGAALTVAAPLAGVLRSAGDGAGDGAELVAGRRVAQGEILLQLLTDLPADRMQQQVRAGEELAAATARLELADARVRRAAELLAAGASSVRAQEEATAERAQAAAAQSAARRRLAILEGTGGKADPASRIAVRAPIAGIIHGIRAAVGQSVPAGAPLLEIVADDHLWLRVPVFAGDLSAIDPDGAAEVRPLLAPSGAPPATAWPTAAPPTADPRAATADLVYALKSAPPTWRPGLRLECSLPLIGPERAPTVATSAVLYDIHGTAWIYESVADNVFTRRRIELLNIHGDRAVLGRGPALGSRIVVAGAAELFGTEFGAKK